MKLKTKENYNLTIQILQNQCFMSFGEAERKARQIFEEVKKHRRAGNFNIKVDDYLVEEIEKVYVKYERED